MRVLFFLGLLFLSVPIVQAQSAAVEALPLTLQSRVVDSDPLTNFRTQNVPQGRVDRDTGVLRAAYRLAPTVPLGITHEATARAYLDAEADRFGWATSDDLSLIREIDGRYSAHLTFQQTFGGVPVHNRFVKVSMGPGGHPSMVINGYAPHLREMGAVRLQPLMDASGAVLRAQQETLAQQISTPELVVYPSVPPRLAWRMTVSPDGTPAAWEVLMDADTGEILYLMDRVVHAHLPSSASARSAPLVPASLPAPAEPATVPAARAVVDGRGLVFDPDPLTTAGVLYGGTYVDNDDADVEVLNAQRKEVVLRDITLGADGLYRLIGPYVEITNSSEFGGRAWTPPAEADPDAFRYGRGNDSFEAVMAYYHIDQNQRYIQSLDVGFPIAEYPILVNPHSGGNYHYPLSSDGRGKRLIFLGDRGVDSAEDADFILHLYAYVLLDESTSSLWLSSEGIAFIYGWSYYWMASYSRGLSEAKIVPEVQDWRALYNWNGFGGRYFFRVDAEKRLRYPENVECDDGRRSGCAAAQDGMLWATTVMEIYDELGKTVTDRLNLASHAYLSFPSTFVDAAEALLQADEDLYDGEHERVLREKLAARGYLSADDAPLSVTLSVSPATVAEDVVTAPVVTVTATVDGDTFAEPVEVMVSVGTPGDSAEEGTDYAAVDDFVIMIPAGVSSATGSFTLDPVDDAIFEGSETVEVTGLLSGGTATLTEITITDDDVSPSVTLGVSPSTVAEDVGTAEVTVTATIDEGRFAELVAVTVSVGTPGDSAEEGTDYAAVDDFEIMIPAGGASATGTFTLNPTNDAILEGDETVGVAGSLSGGTVIPAMVTITDDDVPSTALVLTISPESVGEDASTGEIQITASLNEAVRSEATAVTISVADGTALLGDDYRVVSFSSPLMIPAGMASIMGMVEIEVLEDDFREEDETIVIGVSATGLTSASQDLIITANDASLPVTLSVSPPRVAEDVETAPVVTVTATVDGDRMFVGPQAVTVSVGTSDDSAVEGTDYVAVGDFTITISAGAASATGSFTLDPINDDLAEGSETVSVAGVLVGRTVTPAQFTITDDDVQSTALVLMIRPESVGEDAGTNEIEITASLNGAARPAATAVTISVADGTATSADYATVTVPRSLVIPSGERSVTGMVEIEVVDDDVVEEDETIIIGVSAEGLTRAREALTITDNDASLSMTLGVSPSRVAEDVGTAEVTVTATVDGGTSSELVEVTISVGAPGDSAEEGTDYVAVGDFAITIPAGSSSATGSFTLTPVDDMIAEGSETVSVEGALDDRTVTPAQVTITDDDVPSTALVLTVVPARLHEDSGTSWIRFRASLNNAAALMDTPVDVSVMDGTATAGADYSISVVPTPIMIPAGETGISDSLQITVTDDDAAEGNETVVIGVSAPGLGATTQNLVIIDDETAVRIDVLNVIAKENGDYTITAIVRQNLGAPVTSVVLYYGDGVAFETTPMQTLVMGSNSLYRAELIAPDEGGILYYYVVATNGDGLTARYPPDGRYWDISNYIVGSRLVFLDFENEDVGDKSAVRHHVAYKGGAGALAEGALALDGLDDHAEILGSSLGASEEFALELMFNADEVDAGKLDGSGIYLVAKPTRCSTCWGESMFSLLWGSSGNSGTYVAARFWNSEYEGEQVELEVPLSLVAGQWYHAMLEVQKEDAGQRAVLQLRDRSGLLYGEDAAVLPAAPAISQYPIFVGHIGDRGFFDGRIDDVAFYNYAHFASSLASAEDVGEVPEGYVLEQNYPNPFNPVTTIRYDLARVGHVRLEVSDLLGRKVAMLVDEVQQAGAQEVRFDAGDLPSGMYLYRLRVEDFVSVKKMVLLK